jgi:hypothetical protein
MTFALLIAGATCLTVWLLTSRQQSRTTGVVLGLIASLLWLAAGVAAEKAAVIAVALFCAACFTRPLLRTRMGKTVRGAN